MCGLTKLKPMTYLAEAFLQEVQFRLTEYMDGTRRLAMVDRNIKKFCLYSIVKKN